MYKIVYFLIIRDLCFECINNCLKKIICYNDVKKYVNLLLCFCYGMIKVCYRLRKYFFLGGGIDINFC